MDSTVNCIPDELRRVGSNIRSGESLILGFKTGRKIEDEQFTIGEKNLIESGTVITKYILTNSVFMENPG